ETNIPVINRSRFSPRAGTPAARMKLLPSSVVAQRSKELYRLAGEIAFADLDKSVGFRGPVTIEEHLTGRQAVLARNYAYKPIILPETDASQLLVEVTRRERFHLHGNVLTSN